jgi:chromosome segregation ATPase
VGQHLRVLLREGSDEIIKRFLHQHQEIGNQLMSLRVTAKRMDGREFTASVTRLTWTSDAVLKSKNAMAEGCWTAVFRELPPGSDVTNPPSLIPPEENPGATRILTRMEDVSQFQGSPAALRSANEELQKKLEAMAVDARRKGDACSNAEKERNEFAQRVQAAEAELEKARATIEQEVTQRKLLEVELQEMVTSTTNLQKQLSDGRSKDKISDDVRKELSEAKLAAERAEAARQQETARADGLKQALTNLQHTYDEVNARVSVEKQLVAEAKRKVEELESVVRGTTAEAERANDELEKQLAARSRMQAEWQESVNAAARAATDRAEAACKQEAARADRSERELNSFRQRYDEMEAKVAAEAQAAADARRRVREVEGILRENSAEVERASAIVQKQNAERNRLQADWQDQINAAKSTAERAELTARQESTRATRLERDLTKFREEYDELESKLASEQEAVSELRRRIKELESSLRESNAERDRLSIDRDKYAHGRGAVESDLRAQLASAKSNAERAEAALKERGPQFTRLEEEVARARKEREEIQEKFAAEKEAFAKNKRRVKQLEKQLRESEEECAKAKAGLSGQSGGRSRGDTAYRRITEGSNDLSKELSRLRQNEVTHAAELAELERRVREGVTALSKVTTEVERERDERRKVEQRFATLSVQLQELHVELRRHLETERTSQHRVTELEQKLRDWNRGSKG